MLLYVYISPFRKKSAPLLPDGTVKCKYRSGNIADSQRLIPEINESGAIVKIRIWVESDTVQHLKACD